MWQRSVQSKLADCILIRELVLVAVYCYLHILLVQCLGMLRKSDQNLERKQGMPLDRIRW
jgi:hypothetical protein